MSSRNAYLDPQQRKSALVLYRSLRRVQEVFRQGTRNVSELIGAGIQTMAEDPAVRIDYFEVINPETLDPITEVKQPSLVALAAFVGTTRLIDNLVLA